MFIAPMTVLPFQLGRAFATSPCSSNGTAKMIVSAPSASRSNLATTVGPIARACGANASGGRRLRDGHVDVFTGEGVGEGLANPLRSFVARRNHKFLSHFRLMGQGGESPPHALASASAQSSSEADCHWETMATKSKQSLAHKSSAVVYDLSTYRQLFWHILKP